MEEESILEHSKREKIEDQLFKTTNNDRNAKFKAEITNINYKFKLFTRLGAKEIKFINVDFSHSYFENCYLRDCVFESCNFNGCKFTNCNLVGSSFPGSDFSYSNFDKTFVDNDILENNIPQFENLRLRFARSLRMNYHGLGDVESVSKAMKLELIASDKHLLNAWFSEQKYYRTKYQGVKRLVFFFKWINFKIQKFIWGNGESPKKLLKTGFLLWIVMSIIDVFSSKDIDSVSDYLKSFIEMPAVFFAIAKPVYYSELYLAMISMLRLIGFGLFMSLILKTFNKR